MRSVLKQFAIIAALMLLSIAFFAAGRGEPWVTLAIIAFMLAAMWTIFAIRDAICVALRHSGRQADEYKVLVHVFAVLAFLAALAMGFGSDEPRFYDMRWFLLILLPLTVYSAYYGLEWTFRGMTWLISLCRIDRKSPPASRRTRKRR